MASKTLDVAINAKDGASPVFQKVGNSAKTMGQALDQAAKSGQQGARSLLQSLDQLDSQLTTVGAGLTAFGAASTAAFGLAVRGSLQLESAMQNIASIAEAGTDIEALTDQVRDLAVEMGRSPTELAEGLYEITSSGFAATEAMEILDDTTRAAVAGMTDSETATRAVVAVLNAYGLEAEHAGDVSDIFFQTVESGSASFESLANNLSNVLPVAASLGIEFEEVAAALANLSLQGFSAATGETGVAAIMRAALNPTQELTAAVQELGFTSVEALVEAEGFVGLLSVLESASGGSQSALMDLIGSIEGTNAALGLISSGVDGYAASVNEMSAAARDGATTQEAFAIQTDTTAFALQQARVAINDVAITFGDALAPAIREGAELAQTAALAFRELPEPVQEWTAVLGAGTGALALFTGGVVLAVPKVVEFTAAMRTLQTAGGLATLGSTFAAVAGPAALFTGILAAGSVPAAAFGATIGTVIGELVAGESPAVAFYEAINKLDVAMDALLDGDPAGFFRTLAFGVDQANEAAQSFETTLVGLLDESARQLVLGNSEVGESLEFLVTVTAGATVRADEYIGSAEFMAQANAIAAQTTGDVERATADLTEEFTQSEAEARVYTQAVSALGLAMLDPANNATEIQGRVQELHNAFYSGNITLDQYREGLVDLVREYGSMPGEIDATAASTASLTDATQDLIAATTMYTTALAERDIALMQSTSAADLAAAQAREHSQGIVHNYEEEREARRAAMLDAEEYADTVVSAHERILGPIAETNEAAHALATEGYAEIGASAQAAVDDVLALRAAIFEIGTAGAAGGLGGVEAFNEQIRGFIATMREVGGLDDALSTLNMSSLATETSHLADAALTANSALENTFRIVVEGTNALGQTTQATEDWITSLVGVQGEWAAIDDLLENRVIEEHEYNAAIEAQSDILAANAIVQEEILGIQVRQAPLLADLTAQQAAYVASLGDLPAEQQLIALAFMDMNTAAQTNQIIMQASAVAAGEYGAAGRVAFEQIVEGAIAANPVLEATLTDIGLVARDHEGRLIFDYAGVEQGASEIQLLTDSILLLVDVLDDGVINGSVTIQTLEAEAAVERIVGELEAITGMEASTTVTTDASPALTAMAGAAAQLDAMDGETSTLYVAGDIGAAASAMAAASGQLSALDGDSATVYVNAINNAGGVIGSIASQLAGLDGRTATTYVDTVYRTFGSALSAGLGGLQHGGTLDYPGFAHGGTLDVSHFAGGGMVPFWGGENGPEIARFANGGTALLPHEGLYAAPPMTQIIPNNAISNYGGDVSVTVNHYGGGDRAEMDRWAEESFVPKLTRAIREQRTGLGM